MINKEDFLKPYNIFTTLLAIIFFIIGVIFYYNGKKYREVSYQINEPIAKIFDSKNSTPVLKLIERDSVPVKGNVYLLTGTIWNSGNLPINKEDVRQIITLKLNNSDRILDFKLVKQFEPTIPKFTLIKQTDNSLNLDWKYFDPKYGFHFQVMYVGNEDPGFLLTGKILDVNSFTKGIYSKKDNKVLIWIVFILAILSTSLGSHLILLQRKNRSYVKNRKKDFDYYFPRIGVVAISIFILYMILFEKLF